MEVKHILVVRFRQMGDAILSTPLLNSLRQQYPEAEIHFVLNERIAPLFEGHPSVDRIVTFTEDERHSVPTYIRKVWRIVHDTHYDIIIDMRSTVNTMLFALFSRRSPWRIGIRKPYTWLAFNHRKEGCEDNESMIDHNLALLDPLGKHSQDKTITLHITAQEKDDFRQYMTQQGIDFCRPVMLAGVTAKIASKTWAEDRMTKVLRRFIDAHPEVQIIFNFAPGQEAENARRIYSALDHHPNIFINIEAKSMRSLAAMAANCTFYFGNEGGARHIVQAMGRPSLVVCSPMASKRTWLPENDNVLTRGIAATDIDADARRLSYEQQYALITAERVWDSLQTFYTKIIKTS
ncbi:MAG: glycosyltransferase family 9 protein [Prevotella sp.]|nr:glycosyltransferase family 9 protein [Prevotella sp.]